MDSIIDLFIGQGWQECAPFHSLPRSAAYCNENIRIRVQPLPDHGILQIHLLDMSAPAGLILEVACGENIRAAFDLVTSWQSRITSSDFKGFANEIAGHYSESYVVDDNEQLIPAKQFGGRDSQR